MKNLIFNLLNEMQNLIPEVSELNGYDTDFKKTDNGFVFTAVKKPKLNKKLLEDIKDFKNYVDNVEDFIFDEAIDTFNKVSNIKLVDFQRLIDNPVAENEKTIYELIEIFKNSVKASANDYIEELKLKYSL